MGVWTTIKLPITLQYPVAMRYMQFRGYSVLDLGSGRSSYGLNPVGLHPVKPMKGYYGVRFQRWVTVLCGELA